MPRETPKAMTSSVTGWRWTGNLRRRRLYAVEAGVLCRLACPLARLLSATGGGTTRRSASPDLDPGSIVIERVRILIAHVLDSRQTPQDRPGSICPGADRQRVSTPYEFQKAAGLSQGATIPALKRLLDARLVHQGKPGARGRTDHQVTAAGKRLLKEGWLALIEEGPSGDAGREPSQGCGEASWNHWHSWLAHFSPVHLHVVD